MASAFRHIAAEPSVAPNSNTPTYVAMALHIDNWRWAGVPFYLRTGKRLAKRLTQIVIRFRRPPFVLFRNTSVNNIAPNELVISIQPDEGISLSFEAKVPGPVVRLGAVNMNFQYSDYFGTTPSTGYETLLYDCMMGDSTLFQRADMVEAGGPPFSLFWTYGTRCPRATSRIIRPAAGGPSRVTNCCGGTGVNGAIR